MIGGRKVEHLMENNDAFNITLTEEHIKCILPSDPELPTTFIVSISTVKILDFI